MGNIQCCADSSDKTPPVVVDATEATAPPPQAEEKAAEEPKAEEPKAEEPKTEEPKAEEPPPPAEEPTPPKVTMLFVLPDNSEKFVEVLCKPLGCGFKQEVPLLTGTIAPGGVAEGLGIQSGWKLKELNGQPILDTPSKEAVDMVKAAIKELPDK